METNIWSMSHQLVVTSTLYTRTFIVGLSTVSPMPADCFISLSFIDKTWLCKHTLTYLPGMLAFATAWLKSSLQFADYSNMQQNAYYKVQVPLWCSIKVGDVQSPSSDFAGIPAFCWGHMAQQKIKLSLCTVMQQLFENITNFWLNIWSYLFGSLLAV